MAKRGSIELSMNVFVIVLISLVILAGGITLLYKFLGGAEDIKAQLDEKTNEELERLLVDQGKQVALPLHTATIFRGESHVFGIGILNVGNAGNEFLLRVELSKVLDEQEQDITATMDKAAVESWLLYNTESIILEENGHTKEAILVKVSPDTPRGQYIFNAYIFLVSGEQYGNTQKFIVTVR